MSFHFLSRCLVESGTSGLILFGIRLALSNPNRVLTNEQIYVQIWEEEACEDLATVAVHICKIREKIETDPSNPQYLETVWGSGYRFTAG